MTGPVTYIPGIMPAAALGISYPHEPSASPAHGPALQKGWSLPGDRGARRLVTASGLRQDPEVLLVLFPSDIPRVRIGNAGEPVLLATSTQGLSAIDGAPVLAPPVGIGTGITGIVEHPHDRGRIERPEDNAG